MRQNSMPTYRRHVGVILTALALSVQSCAVFSSSSSSNKPPATSQRGSTTSATQSAVSNHGASTSNATGQWTRPDENKSLPLHNGDRDMSLSADDWLRRSLEDFDAQRFGDAFSAAINSHETALASGDGEIRDESATLAVAAAARLDGDDLKQRLQTTVSPIEKAILTRFLASRCHAQGDRECVATQVVQSALAWETIGDEAHAREMAKWNDSLHPDLTTVAVLLPLSGKDRRMGRAMLGSFLLAAGIYDHRELPFALKFFDTQSDAASIESLIASLAFPQIRLVLGPVDVLESAKTAQFLPDDIAMIGFSPNDAFISDRPNVFQYAYTLDREAQELAELLVGMNPRRIIAVAPQDAYAETTLSQVNAYLPPANAISAELYPASQTDLRDVAKRIKAQNPDVIFFPTQVDDAERMASFLAQENVWCQSPGVTAPRIASDTRQFVTCLSTSAWAPIRADHRYKFIVNALYLDYMENADDIDASFSAQFSSLYHRMPSVYEVAPYAIVSLLRSISAQTWKSPDELQNEIRRIFNGNRYLLTPDVRQVVANGSTLYRSQLQQIPVSDRDASLSPSIPSLPVRSLTVK